MATPKGSPSVPTAPITRNGLWTSDGWLIFFNSIIAWLKGLFLRGTRAQQPAANTVYPGTLYYVTDEGVIEISDGVNWLPYSGIGSVFVDAAGALDGDGTVGDPLAVRVDNNSVVIDGSNNLTALVLLQTTVLTNAEVKALPTTPKQLLAAPGSGFWYRILAVTYVAECTAGIYTNIDATYADLRLDYSGGQTYVAGYVADDPTSTPAVADLTSLLAVASQQVLPSQSYLEATLAGATPGYVHYGGANAVSGVENKAIVLAGENNGSGDWTGGDAANTLTVKLYYIREAI